MFSINNFSFFKKILIFYFQCYNFDSKSIKNHHNTVSKEFQNETDIKLYYLLLVIIAPNFFWVQHNKIVTHTETYQVSCFLCITR